jgi:hypothetical protein
VKYLTLIFLTACGPDAFFSFPPDGGSEAAVDGDAAADSQDSQDAKQTDGQAEADACQTQAGQTECDSVITAYCTRYTACFGGTVQSCKGDCASSQGLNCSDSKFNRNVCVGSASSCESFIETTACSNLNTCSRLAPACSNFWNQFP